MHLFFVDTDYNVVKQVNKGYLMQYSDNVDMVFFAMLGATSAKPTTQSAALSWVPNGTGDTQLVMMNWDNIEYKGERYFGWSCAISSSMTQIEGTVLCNGIITDTSGEEAVEHMVSTVELTVNKSAGDTSWTEAMNYAQWKELISYFLDSSGNYVTIDTEQTITGEKTFEGVINVKDTNTLATYSTSAIAVGSDVFTYPSKGGGNYVFAMTSDVATALNEAEGYTDSSLKDYAKKTDLSGYATQAYVDSTFATNTAVDTKLADYVLKENHIHDYAALNDALNLEVDRATAKEKSLESAIESEIADRKTGDNETLYDAKTYTDGEIAEAKEYTDTQIKASETAWKEADATTLLNAKTYTDSSLKDYVKSTELASYATQEWVIGKGYITSSALSGYATQTWVTNKGYITSSALDGYAKTEDISSTYATIASLNEETASRETGDANALASAKAYADEKTSAEATARETADNALQTNIDAERAYADKTFVTLATSQTVSGAKTFTANNKFTNESTFAHENYAPTWSDIANGIGKSGKFTRGAFMQLFTGQIMLPNSDYSYASRGYNTESGKLKIQTYTVSGGQPTKPVEIAVFSTSGLDITGTLSVNGSAVASGDDVTSALATAKSYADEKVSAEADEREKGDTSTLSSAKTYTDEQIKASETAWKEGDTATLSNAKEYTDTALKDYSKTTDIASTYATKTEVSAKMDTADFTSANIVGKLGTTPVNRATADGNGNNIVSTYATKTALASETSDRETGDANTLSSAKEYVDGEIETVNSSIADLTNSKVSKSGDTMTGKLSVPYVETGTGASNYFQSRKFRGEGAAGTYYHAIDFGYSQHDQVDFYEYGGKWNFWKNTQPAATTDTSNLVASLQLGKLVERANTLAYPGKSGTFALTSDVSTCFASAKSYADAKVSAEASSRETGDSDTLASAKAYVDEQIGDIDFSDFASLSKGNSFVGDQVINGDLTVNGTFKKVDAETISTKEYTIGLAKGNTTAIASYVGLYATKYDGTNDGALVWDNSGTAYVGDCSVDDEGKVTDVSMQPIMTRADSSSLASNALLMWDSENLKATKATDSSGNAITNETIQGIIAKNTSQDSLITQLANNSVSKWGDTMKGTLTVPSIKCSEMMDANGVEWFSLLSSAFRFGDGSMNFQTFGSADRPTYNGNDLMLASDNKLTASDVSIVW